MAKKIAVGLSGGVDSSVAAYLLKKKGWDVTGFTLKFFPQENRCCDLDSLYQARRLCHKLDIPHYVFDVGRAFKKEVIEYFVNSYLQGQTPNPCAYCNRLIKFGIFINKIKSLGIDYLATGHYACLQKKGASWFIKRSRDSKKSQEYFLSLLEPGVLKHLVFPLGGYTKETVKKIAREKEIVFKERKESQDVCFVREKSYSEFIETNISGQADYSGDIKHVTGKVLGRHKGFYNYTCGQRSGLGISWPQPLYVINIDSAAKTVFVGEKEFLGRKTFSVNYLNWFLNPEKYLYNRHKSKNLKVKVRYNSNFLSCSLKIHKNKALVTFNNGAETVTPGQVAAFYYKDLLLGGGTIEPGERGDVL